MNVLVVICIFVGVASSTPTIDRNGAIYDQDKLIYASDEIEDNPDNVDVKELIFANTNVPDYEKQKTIERMMNQQMSIGELKDLLLDNYQDKVHKLVHTTIYGEGSPKPDDFKELIFSDPNMSEIEKLKSVDKMISRQMSTSELERILFQNYPDKVTAPVTDQPEQVDFKELFFPDPDMADLEKLKNVEQMMKQQQTITEMKKILLGDQRTEEAEVTSEDPQQGNDEDKEDQQNDNAEEDDDQDAEEELRKSEERAEEEVERMTRKAIRMQKKARKMQKKAFEVGFKQGFLEGYKSQYMKETTKRKWSRKIKNLFRF